jgi:hypothetical protein
MDGRCSLEAHSPESRLVPLGPEDYRGEAGSSTAQAELVSHSYGKEPRRLVRIFREENEEGWSLTSPLHFAALIM